MPTLVARERLATAGGRMMASQSLAGTIGPSISGAIVQTIGAAFAIAVDAVSFLVSAVSLVFMRIDERHAAVVQREFGRSTVWPEVRRAFALIARDPILRAVVVGSALFNLFAIMRSTVYILAVTRDLNVSPAILGLAVAASGPSSILTSLAAPTIMRRVGIGPSILAGLTLVACSFCSAPIAELDPPLTVPTLAAGQILLGAGLALGHVPFGVVVQTRVPPDGLGRVWATLRVLFDCAIPVGALIGGALGTVVGLNATQVIATIGCLLSVAVMVGSPVRTLCRVD
jgi:predicted MFS family arabinose efflux permease